VTVDGILHHGHNWLYIKTTMRSLRHSWCRINSSTVAPPILFKPSIPLMKTRSLALVLIASLPAASSGAPITRGATADALNVTTAWVGDVLPTTADTATWDASSTLVNTLGGNLSWGGLDLAAAGGNVSIGGANSLTLGSAGLNTGSTANLTLNNTGNVTLNGPMSGSTTLTLNSTATKNWTGAASTSFTGTLVLRGGTAASGSFSNNWVAVGAPAFSQTGSFSLDTGESLTNRGEFIVTDAWGDGTTKPKMALNSLTGFGDFRSDLGGTGNRTISLNSAANHEFQGRIVQNNNSTRSVHLEKLGSGTLTVSGENAYQNTIVGEGRLRIGNGGTTGNIGFGTVSIASGATLEFNRSNLLDYKASARMRNVSGAGNILLDGGVKLFNYTGTGTGFADANSWNNFAGTLTIKGGSEFQTIRNGATAMGTAQVVLGDGTSSGKLSQIEGNWTWTNPILLAGSSNEILNNGSGADRFNKLQGVISGSGGVTFKDSTGAMGNGDRGFILTGTNTMDGVMTVDTFVRVGGIPGNDPTITGGPAGTLGNASVVINGGKRLTFTRTDSHLVANPVSGAGDVHVGTNGLAETATQMVEFTGAKTYTGATSVNRGRLHLTGSLTSNVTVASAAKLSGSGSTTGLLTLLTGASLALPGGATTTSLSAGDGADIAGAATVIFDTDPVASTVYDVFTYGDGEVTGIGNLSVAWRGTLTDDIINKKYIFTAGAAGTRTWNTTSGDWEQGVDANFAEGDNLFYGGDTLFFNNPAEDSTITMWGPLVPESMTVNNTNAYTFTGTGYLSGPMTLTKTGPGALTLASANTYTGGTVLQQGQLNINDPSAIGSTASVLTIAGVSSLDNTSGVALTLSTNNPQAWNADFTFIGSNNLNLGTGAVTLGADRLVTVNANNLTVGGAIGGSFGITKAGAGTLTLGGALSYSGNTLVSTGTLRVTSGANILIPGIEVASGAVFEWAPTVNNVSFGGTLTGTGKVLRTDSAANNAVFTGDNSSFNGSWEITGDYLGFTSDAGIGAPSLGMTWNGGGIFFTATGNTLAATRTITLGASGGFLNGTTNNTNTFAAKFTGAGNLNKVSGERAILTHPDNDFTGAITITGGGTLEIGGAGRLGSGLYSPTISIAAANTLAVNSSADQFLTGVISGAGRLVKGGAGTLSLDAVNTYTGTTTIDGGTLVIGAGDSLYSTGGFFGAPGTTNVFINSGGTLETRNWHYGVGFAFNEMRHNSYAIRINGGRVRFTENTSAVRGFQVGANGATLEAVGGVTYTKLAGTVPDDNVLTGVTGGSLTLDGAGNGEILDAIGTHGTWDPAAGVIKEGSGTWTISGSNTYTGTTVVNAGKLAVDGGSIPDSGRLDINGSGKLEVIELIDPVVETVGTLFINGVQMAAGTYGATGSGAANIDNTRFEGAGVLSVVNDPPAGGYANWASTHAPTGTAADDFDGDGVPNAVEYILGGTKDTNDLGKLPVAGVSGGNFSVSFVRDQDSKSPDVTVTIHVGTTLSTWPLAFNVATAPQVSTLDHGDGTETVTLTIPMAPDARKFARLGVEVD
jgi:autotransporter-associated beta strand protein